MLGWLPALAVRLAPITIVITTGSVLGWVRPGHVMGIAVPGWLALVATGLVMWAISGQQEDRRPVRSIIRTSLLAALLYVVFGVDVVFILAAGYLLALLTTHFEALYSQLISRRRIQADRLRLCRGWWRAHSIWSAARNAKRAGHAEAAEQSWGRLAMDTGQTRPVRAAASAEVAGLRLAAGDLQTATEWAERALGEAPRRSRVASEVSAIAGQVLVAVGDTERARDL